jgi:hypothetical protein
VSALTFAERGIIITGIYFDEVHLMRQFAHLFPHPEACRALPVLRATARAFNMQFLAATATITDAEIVEVANASDLENYKVCSSSCYRGDNLAIYVTYQA